MKRMIPLLLSVFVLLCACQKKDTAVQKTLFTMDTVMELKIWGKDADAAVGQITTLLNRLDKTWNASSDASVPGMLRADPDVQFDEEAARVLQRAEEFRQRTDGAFNPHMHAVSQVWGFYEEEHHVPSPEQIAQAMEKDQWDLGAAIKGYAGQEAVKLLSDLDIDRAMLNLGGNVQTYGEKPGGAPWEIAIRDPDNDSGYVGIVKVEGTASVVTSGDYQRFFELDGKRYHHILDPETGCPAESGLRSVTVICRDGMTADCLSTALFVMGAEKAAVFWRESDDFQMVMILTDGRILATENAGLSGCEFEVISR